MPANAIVTPRLIVREADKAIAFYTNVFGARERHRFTMPDGRIIDAELIFENGSGLTLTSEDKDNQNVAPKSLGGSAVILSLATVDPDAVCKRAVAAGAKVVFPVADQFYGRREGRIKDPFGHIWILSKTIEDLTPAEIQARVDQWASA
ncbi:MAG: VOC family protein [Deltaproteobacteria bacterium]|nr:VOC family protein [Deltaproteobacteria bacterium]